MQRFNRSFEGPDFRSFLNPPWIIMVSKRPMMEIPQPPRVMILSAVLWASDLLVCVPADASYSNTVENEKEWISEMEE